MSEFAKHLPHLQELRKRALCCFAFFVVLLLPLLFFCKSIYLLLAQPLLAHLPKGSHLVATKVTTPLTAPVRLACFSALLGTIPFICYHSWAFIIPGLYSKEKRVFGPLCLLSISLFFSGVAFAHYVVCPLALGFFIHMAPANVAIMTDISHYLDFMLGLYLVFGAAFQIPLITFALIWLKIVPLALIKQKRPVFIVGAFILGMLLTPPDVISQVCLAIPFWLLFEIGLGLAHYFKA